MGRDKPVPHVEYLPQDRLGVGMETSLLLLCGPTVLEVVLFQEVHVNLIVDIIQLQSCGLSDKANCHIVGRIYESQTGNFLQLCSVINIVINVMNLVFVYVTRSRQRHNNSVPVSVWCLNISTSGRLVTCWTVFKIVFNSVLVCGLLLTGGVTVTSVILISSLGYLVLLLRLLGDLTDLTGGEEDGAASRLTVQYRKLSTEDV